MTDEPAPLRLSDPPWIVAHRGASEAFPENTLAAFEAALTSGARMIELDLQLTADGRIVAVHDWSVEVDGRPRVVEESPFAALRNDPASADHPFPPLGEILELVPEAMPLNLEIKRRRAPIDRWVERLEEALRGRGNALISSFDFDLLERVRAELPGRPVAPIGSRQPHALLRAAERLDAWSVHCHRRLAFDELLRAARASRWPVLVYTVNDLTEARRLLDRGVAGLFTDAPDRLTAGLELPNPQRAP